MIDKTEGKLQETLEFAKQINDIHLQGCLDSLKMADENCNSETHIYNDWAEKSFEFARIRDGKCITNGGVIWNGGSNDPLSVTLNNSITWQIHT